MIFNCLKDIFKSILYLLDTNFAQFFLLLLTLLLTFFIFKKEQKDKEIEAATIIKLQIEDMKSNFDTAYASIQNYEPEKGRTGFDIEKIWGVTRIFATNDWEKMRHLIIRYLDQNDIKKINKYYECANVANFQIEKFHKIIYKTYEDFYLTEKMKENDAIKYTQPHIRTFSMHVKTLKECCEKACSIFEDIQMNKLDQIINLKINTRKS